MQTYVYCTTRVVGFHNWPNAPFSSEFLKSKHRHEFHIKVIVNVVHNDRDIEFIRLREDVDEMFAGGSPVHNFGSKSCEMIAEDIKSILETKEYKVHSVEVSEDGENGAILVWE